MVPWAVAQQLFRDRADLSPQDDRIATLSRWRSILGIACTLYFTLAHRSPLDMVQEGVLGLALLVVVTVVVVAIAVGVLVAMTPSGHRPALRSGLSAPLRTVVLALATVVAPPLMGMAFTGSGSAQGLWSVLLALGLLWWIAFAVPAIWYLAQSVLSVAEVHPMLAPICGVTAVWIKAGLDLLAGDRDGLPEQLWLMLTMGSLVSVALLGAVEYAQHRRYGIRLVPAP